MDKKKPMDFFEVRPVVGIALVFLTAIVLGKNLRPHYLWIVGIGIGMILLCLSFFLHQNQNQKKKMAIGILTFFIGITLSSATFFPLLPEEGKYLIRAVVQSEVKEKENGSYGMALRNISLDNQKIKNKGYWTFTSKNQEMVQQLKEGSEICFYGKVYHPKKQQNPGGFDYFNYLNRQGISLGIYASEGLEIVGFEKQSFIYSLAGMREKIGNKLDEVMGKESALVKTMVLGDKNTLDEEVREDFTTIGLAHILAISGLHITILAAMILTLLKKTPLGIKGQWLVMAVVLLAYTLFVGGAPSVVRASILFLIYLGAKATGKVYDDLTALAIAAIGIIGMKPVELFSPGFQLSFGAVAGILLLAGPIKKTLEKRIKGRKKMTQKVLEGLSLTLAAQMGVLLPMAYWFHKIPLLGILTNVLLLPLISGILIPFYFLTVLVAYLPYLGGFFGRISSELTKAFIRISQFLAGIPSMEIQVFFPRGVMMAFIVGGMVLFSPFVKIEKRKKAIAMGVGASVIALVMVLTPYTLPVTYTQFSVGQADTAVIEDGKYTIVVDAGENGGDLASYLLAKGKEIDGLYISHLHMDHVGGLRQLIDHQVRIGQVYLPYEGTVHQLEQRAIDLITELERKNIPITYLAKGDIVTYDKCKIEALWPVKGKVKPSDNANHYSLVLGIEVFNNTVLTTGDITGAYEKYSAANVDVLKVSHHGSKGSSLDGYLDVVAPKVALISSGTSERLPAKEMLLRLEKRNIPYYETEEWGNIKVVFSEKGYSVYPYY